MLVLGGTVFRFIIDFVVDYQWFSSVGYLDPWLTRILTNWAIHLFVGLLFFLFVFVNLLFTLPLAKKALDVAQSGLAETQLFAITDWVQKEHLLKYYVLFSLVPSFLFSQIAADRWKDLLMFFNSQSFGVADPLFGLDVGFYIFNLPLLEFIYGLLQVILIITAILLAVIYQLINIIGFGRISWKDLPRARFHLAWLVAAFFVIKALGYRLDMYGLLYSPSGVAFGASYADVHAHLPGLQILTVIALIAAAGVVFGLLMRRIPIAVISIGGLFLASILLQAVYPTLIQRFKVEPNEFNMEKPYIENNIHYTRLSYGLDKIEEKPLNLEDNLTLTDLTEYKETIGNVRLWDWRPLQQTYSQLQEIRLYYKFKGVDIDRYTVDGQYRQVMLSARELDPNALQDKAQTWINQKLLYTHGYGVAMSPVNEVTVEGLPRFFLQDIPPKSVSPDIDIKRPQIYFGEGTNDYVIVKTAAKEFDYPSGNENVYTTYEAESGVPVGSFWQRLLFAAYYGDIKILLTPEITPESKILMNRNVVNRMAKVVPFLRQDSDPYLVVHEGRLSWIIDAYTASNRYPYAEPIQGVGNYIRNSVKAVIDAYTGDISFYVADLEDPIIKSYQQMFPGMFQGLEKMPDSLKGHMRYPEELFLVQSKIYSTFHMLDPGVFYNKEDEWNFPRAVHAKQNESATMEPYYTIMRLPGEQKPEFILMLPFTPARKDNMIAWMAARSDGQNYGKLIVYTFPKQKLIYGPAQIEARIDQDSVISQNITLWSQRGSSVIRGNLLALPIKNSLLYIQPLFLQSDQGKLPALRRVIVIYGENVVMEENLETALERIFGRAQTRISEPLVPGTPTEPAKEGAAGEVPRAALSFNEMAKQANSIFNQAQERLKAGDWAGYGQNIEELQRILQNMESRPNS